METPTIKLDNSTPEQCFEYNRVSVAVVRTKAKPKSGWTCAAGPDLGRGLQNGKAAHHSASTGVFVPQSQISFGTEEVSIFHECHVCGWLLYFFKFVIVVCHSNNNI